MLNKKLFKSNLQGTNGLKKESSGITLRCP